MDSKVSGYIMSQPLSVYCNQNMNSKTDGCIMDQLVKYPFKVYLKRQKKSQCQNVLITSIYVHSACKLSQLITRNSNVIQDICTHGRDLVMCAVTK